MPIRRNVLIFHAGALGDFVLSWPLALALSRIYAQSRIFYVAQAAKGALAEAALRVESRDVEAGWSSLFAANAAPPAEVARMLDGAHAIVSFVAPPDSDWTRNVQRLAPAASLQLLEPNPPADFTGHATEYVLQQLAAAPILSAAVSQILRSVAERGIGAARKPGGAVVIHPGSGSPAKCWPIDRFVALCEHLSASGRKPVVIFGEVERERWSAEDLARFSACATVQHPASHVELFRLLLSASAVIANDSGPAHLAGICATPTIVLFGPSDPQRWRPLGPRVRVLHKPTLDAIKLQDVIAAYQAAVSG